MPNAFPNLYPYTPIQRTPYPINIHPPTSTPVTTSTTQQTTPSNNHTAGESKGWRNKQEKVQFDPIPISYAELFTQLVANHLVAPLYIEPLKPPFPRCYDVFAHYDYHYGIEGHSIENYTAFKYKMQGLIKARILNFEKKPKQNVNNPLPNHIGVGVNPIEGEMNVKRNIREVETPMEKVFKALVKACMLEEVQRMMDESKIEFYVEASRLAVNMMAKDSTHPMKIKPLTIFYEPKGKLVEDKTQAKMTIEAPKPFPYKDDKVVPWNYNCNVQVSNAGKWMVESQDNAVNITSVGGITRSECCYTLEALENLRKEKRKEKEQNSGEEKVQSQESINGSKGSEPYRNSLMRIMNQAYVDHDILVENLDYIIGNISVGNIISFSDEEILSGGRGNYKALHITTKCKGCTVAKVLLDNGSSLNVMPMRTLARLPIDMSYMKKSQMIVMDITSSYNYLLGRPWIHMVGAIPSSLHQKVKFIMDEKIVCVNGEVDLLISKPVDTPYVEAAEEVPECSFRSFEFVKTPYIGEGTTPPILKLSKTTKMAVSQIVGK
ncbi:PREDICTED: uncharacterized protein LOC108661379 [Theobroma cacao]|uniref:Uncharacterized protein LOC108661379 n=1 Tax=Theobroma cacao TaxID=3641 RepID=A0AB32W1X1_THECC|nr:PREDICTED: uncharacterized protein LOC108661379 [Theobroma cacao]